MIRTGMTIKKSSSWVCWSVAVALTAVLPALAAATGEPCLEAVGGYPYGPIRAVVQDGDLVAYGSGRTLILSDFTDPASPTILAELVLDGLILDIDLAGDLAYVATASAGLVVVDRSVPEDPVAVGRLPVSWRDRVDLDVYGPYVFAGGEGHPMVIIDSTDPENPVEVGGSGSMGYASWIEIEGERLYTINGYEFTIYGLADPSNPDELGGMTMPTAGDGFVVVDSMGYSVAYIVTQGSLDVYNVSSPSIIFPPSTTELGQQLYGIEIHNSLASIPAMTETGFAMLLVDLDGNVIGEFATDTLHLALSMDSARLLYSDRFSGLFVVDVSVPSAPLPITEIEAPGFLFRLAAAGDTVFATSIPAEYYGPLEGFDAFTTDFRAFDLADGAVPVQTDRVDFGEFFPPFDLIIEDGLAYVGGEFKIVNIQDPDQLELLGEFDIEFTGMAKRGSLVYGVRWSQSANVIDVQDPTNPELVTEPVPLWPHGQEGIDIAIAGDHGYVVSTKPDFTGGYFIVLGFTNPLAPEVVAMIDYPETPAQIVIDGNHAYVRNLYSNNIHVIDIEDPAGPELVGTAPWGWWDGDIVVSGDVLYSARLGGGIAVIDISDPASPTLICEHDVDTRTDALAVSGGSLFVAAGDCGFTEFRQHGGALFLDGFEIGTTQNWSDDPVR